MLDLNSSLIALFINWNKFTAKGAVGIAQGLAKNKGLQILDASFNAFGSHPKPGDSGFDKVDRKAAMKTYREKMI